MQRKCIAIHMMELFSIGDNVVVHAISPNQREASIAVSATRVSLDMTTIASG